jgi:hypothetical protein
MSAAKRPSSVLVAGGLSYRLWLKALSLRLAAERAAPSLSAQRGSGQLTTVMLPNWSSQ